ncbi:hypothetical protein IW140_006584, partial [Coemansia sp. RSA 1813]
MQHCPRDHTDEAPEEMREHLLECTIGDLELPAPQMGSIVAAWTNEYVPDGKRPDGRHGKIGTTVGIQETTGV